MPTVSASVSPTFILYPFCSQRNCSRLSASSNSDCGSLVISFSTFALYAYMPICFKNVCFFSHSFFSTPRMNGIMLRLKYIAYPLLSITILGEFGFSTASMLSKGLPSVAICVILLLKHLHRVSIWDFCMKGSSPCMFTTTSKLPPIFCLDVR